MHRQKGADHVHHFELFCIIVANVTPGAEGISMRRPKILESTSGPGYRSMPPARLNARLITGHYRARSRFRIVTVDQWVGLLILQTIANLRNISYYMTCFTPSSEIPGTSRICKGLFYLQQRSEGLGAVGGVNRFFFSYILHERNIHYHKYS